MVGNPNQLLDAQDMNHFLNSSDMLISKPGGSITAEILETETPIYMCALNDGEVENASYLLRSGLGIMHDGQCVMGKKIEELLMADQGLQLNQSFKLPNWRASLTQMLMDLDVLKPALP